MKLLTKITATAIAAIALSTFAIKTTYNHSNSNAEASHTTNTTKTSTDHNIKNDANDPNVINALSPTSNVENRYQNFNVNPFLPVNKLQISQQAEFIPDNNAVLLSHVPNKDTDMSNPISNTINNEHYTKVKILDIQSTPWKIYYYKVKFKDGQTGWLPQSSLSYNTNLYQLNHKTYQHSDLDFNRASQFYAYNYINYIRYLHHLPAFNIDDKLNYISAQRNQQLPNRFNHKDTNGKYYDDELAQQDGFPSNYQGLGENISSISDQPSLAQATIQCINIMTYADGLQSHWDHRDNILTTQATKIGINVSMTNHVIYITMQFGN